MSYAKTFLLIACSLMLASCGDMMDDLNPSDSDHQSNEATGTTGHLPGQVSADFSLKDSLDNNFRLYDYLADGKSPSDVVVLYFTMWCPICLSHTDHLFNQVIPRFQDRGKVVYVLVDYVSGSVSATQASAQANGYGGSEFIVLADVDQKVFQQFDAAMATVVAIDEDGTVLLNEDYKNSVALVEILDKELK